MRKSLCKPGTPDRPVTRKTHKKHRRRTNLRSKTRRRRRRCRRRRGSRRRSRAARSQSSSSSSSAPRSRARLQSGRVARCRRDVAECRLLRTDGADGDEAAAAASDGDGSTSTSAAGEAESLSLTPAASAPLSTRRGARPNDSTCSTCAPRRRAAAVSSTCSPRRLPRNQKRRGGRPGRACLLGRERLRDPAVLVEDAPPPSVGASTARFG